jgi:hypothetical protein
VANTGLMLDAASRASTKDARLRVEGLELNGERCGELNTERQRSENGGGIRGRGGAEAGWDKERAQAEACATHPHPGYPESCEVNT